MQSSTIRCLPLYCPINFSSNHHRLLLSRPVCWLKKNPGEYFPPPGISIVRTLFPAALFRNANCCARAPHTNTFPKRLPQLPPGSVWGGGGRRLQRWGGPPQQCLPTSAGGCAISRCLGTQSTSQHGCPALRRRSARVLSETGGGEGGQTPPFAGGGPRPPPPLRPSPGPPLLPNFFLRRIAVGACRCPFCQTKNKVRKKRFWGFL